MCWMNGSSLKTPRWTSTGMSHTTHPMKARLVTCSCAICLAAVSIPTINGKFPKRKHEYHESLMWIGVLLIPFLEMFNIYLFVWVGGVVSCMYFWSTCMCVHVFTLSHTYLRKVKNPKTGLNWVFMLNWVKLDLNFTLTDCPTSASSTVDDDGFFGPLGGTPRRESFLKLCRSWILQLRIEASGTIPMAQRGTDMFPRSRFFLGKKTWNLNRITTTFREDINVM